MSDVVARLSALRRLELALGAAALAALLGAGAIVVDVMRFHAGAVVGIEDHGIHSMSWPLAVASLAVAVLIARGARSLVRHVSALRVVDAAVNCAERQLVGGECVAVVAHLEPLAFCGGLLRPRVVVSSGVLRALSGDGLRAVVAHESHHAARRDPLRQLAARVLADAFPPLRALARRHAAIADLAADAAAVRVTNRHSLARALLAFEASTYGATGVAPERVDELFNAGSPRSVPSPLLWAAAAGLGGLVVLVLGAAFLPGHPDPCHAVGGAAVGCAAFVGVVIALSFPAVLASRRAARALETA